MKKNYGEWIDFRNLERMRDYLVENQGRISPKFDMDVFRNYYERCNNAYGHECMTVGCVLGWGVEAFSLDELKEAEAYVSESDEVCFWTFGSNVLGLDEDDEVWTFLFSSDWKPIDNTLEGAIERLNHVLSDKPMNEHEHYQEFIKTL